MGTPTVTPITEAWHAGAYIVWEPQEGMVTRDSIVLASGNGVLTAGTVLGQIGHTLTGSAAALGTNSGNGTFGAIAVADPAVAGAYVVEFDDATHYIVSAPTGQEIGHANTGAAFNAGGLSFTITAGGTPFAPGDSFTVTVAQGSGKFVPLNLTANDGSEVAAGILYSGRKDTTSADQKAVANTRGPMRVNGGELIWPAGITTNQKNAAIAQLQALPGGGIRVG